MKEKTKNNIMFYGAILFVVMLLSSIGVFIYMTETERFEFCESKGYNFYKGIAKDKLGCCNYIEDSSYITEDGYIRKEKECKIFDYK